MRYIIKETQEAAIKALKTGDSAEIDRIHHDNKEVMSGLLERLMTGEIDSFQSPGENTVYVYTRSLYPGVKVQCTCVWNRNGEMIPLSHHDINGVEDVESWVSGEYIAA